MKYTHCIAALGLVGLAVTVDDRQVCAQTFSPYADFQGMSQSELASLRVKLTYVDAYSLSQATLLIGGPTAPLTTADFTPFRRAGFIYAQDELGPLTTRLSTQLLRAVLDSVGTLPGVTDGGVDAGGYVSFSLLTTVGQTRAFEAIVDTLNGTALFRELIEAVQSDAVTRNAVRAFGCSMGMLPEPMPTEVTGLVQVRQTGLRLDRASGQYVGKITVTNTSEQPLVAPVLLVAGFHAEASIVEADGATCIIEPAGSSFVTLVDSGSLGPGQQVERVLHVVNPGKVKLNVQYRVFAGAGTP